APVGKWTCAPTSTLAPLDKYPISTSWHAPLVLAPNHVLTSGNNLCGQCVSYGKKVCPNLPSTDHWKKGAPVKGNTTIIEGTVIATFNSSDHFEGHAAIYVNQDINKNGGIRVYDQYITPPNPKPVGPRL